MKALRILIIEDEPINARNLAFLLKEQESTTEIVGTLPSVAASIAWFGNGNTCDLIFMDIQLTDGLSFEIFEHVAITQPVVFVTAYDEYALRAFQTMGIDYILKPYAGEDVSRALKKFRDLLQPAPDVRLLLQTLHELKQEKEYRKSFLVHHRNKLIPVPAESIAWFYTKEEVMHACTKTKQQYFIEHTLEELQQLLDPELFFRANRQFIVQRNCIQEVDFYFNGRLLLQMNPPTPEHALISKARVPEFRRWMSR